jgi:hypothetical protein
MKRDLLLLQGEHPQATSKGTIACQWMASSSKTRGKGPYIILKRVREKGNTFVFNFFNDHISN